MDEIIIAREIRKTPRSAEDAIFEQLSADNHLLRHRCQELEKSMDERNAALMLANQYRHGLEIDNRRLLKQLEEQGYVITALRAEAEQVEQLQQQLESRDLECEELRHALGIARLPPESRNNVIQLVRESAA